LDVRPLLNLISPKLRVLPFVVLYITDGCNSRCITCDIWKLPRRNLNLSLAQQIADEFAALGGRAIFLSGGEAMQHPAWTEIASLFRTQGVSVHLITNGLLLRKQADAVITHFDSVTVSLDGANPSTYAAIRGVDAFELVTEGIKAISHHLPVTTRTTLQKQNFQEISAIITLGKSLGVAQVSFLAVDTSSHEAFGPRFAAEMIPLNLGVSAHTPALDRADLTLLAQTLDDLERNHSADFASGLIAESPAKLRRLYDYFAALQGVGTFEPPRCNAPHISTVIEVDGAIRPCFFLPTGGHVAEGGLKAALNSTVMVGLRRAYQRGERPECNRCVCPLYRGARTLLRGG